MTTLLNLILDILRTPAILVGLIAFIGLSVQKKSFSDIIKGSLKTIIGFVIIGAGASVLISSLNYFSIIFREAFGIKGVVPNNESIIAIAQATFGSKMALIMIGAFVVNILWARFTPLKYIFLTGHHTMFMATLTAVIFSVAGLSTVCIILIGSLVTGSMMVLMPALGQKYMREVTKTEDIAIGHFSTLSYLLAGFIGQIIGNKDHSTEDFQCPKSLMFLRDTPVAVALTMFIFFFISSFVAGSAFVTNLSGGQHYVLFAFLQSTTFAVGVYIVLQGVKMLISEIILAFKGISDKIVPGAKPALDCPVTFPYAPNAVLIGFIASFTGGLVSLGLQFGLGWTAIIPGAVPHFFIGATAGVFGNATGGVRGAILGAFMQGILISFLPMWLLPLLGDLGLKSTTFADADFGAIGLMLGLVIR